jgi:hypothetical protein
MTLALAGGVSLFAALIVHEFHIFGAQAHDLIAASSTPCLDPPCLTVGMVVSGHIAKAVGAAMVFALIGAIWTRGAERMLIAAGYWVVQYTWSLVGIASGYRLHFGTGWAWWEPFAELMWTPIATPGLLAAGLVALIGLDRVLRPAPQLGAA